MKTLLTLATLSVSASLFAQVKDSITSEWVVIGLSERKDFEPLKESAWLSIENKTDVAYDSIKVQYRITEEGIIEQRQRFYYTK